MPRPEDNILDAIEHMSSQKRPLFAEGVVLSADNGIAEVQIMGSLSRQPAYYNENQNVETGMACVIALLPTRQRYVILNAFNAVGRNMGLSARPADSFELAPPSGLTLNNAIPGFVIATWNAPPQQPVAFQVQTNSVASESGANTFLTTRGSYAIIETSSEIYVRVRSISSTFNTSSWTDWLSETPISTDAYDIPYEPDDSSDYDGDIETVGDALDELADRVSTLEAAPGGGASNFTDLGDAPSDYTGHAGKAVIVNNDEDGLTFGTVEASVTGQVLFATEGNLSVSQNPLRIYNQMGNTKTILKVFLSVSTPPTGQAIIVDIHKNGTTIFTNQAHRPQIATASSTGYTTDIDVNTWADGEYLEMHIDQVGSVVIGANLVVHVIYQ